MQIKLDLDVNIEAIAQAAFYDAVMQEYGASATKILADTKLKENNSVVEVNSFLSEALLMGHKPYDLKRGLLASNKTKTSTSGRHLTVPIENKFVSLTDKSKGWIHPGFEEKEWLPLFHYILQERLMEAILS